MPPNVQVVDAGKRNQTVVSGDSPIVGYQIARKDDDGSPNYYGFVNAAGNWYILKETLSPGDDTYTYAKGVKSFADAWTGRAGLTYDFFDIVF